MSTNARPPTDLPRGKSRALPAGVWALGFVSLLMDVSSEMIHALLPVYLVAVMGASTLEVGVIEGIAEATAAITKVFSGALSDWLGRRKMLAVLGYGLAALVKPVFPLATSLGWVVAARFADRVGKGIRGAPRDALVADIAPADQRGAAFGLRQSLDTVGALLGPLGAMALMWATAGAFREVFWVAVIPAFLSLLLIVVAVREPPHMATPPVRVPLRRVELRRMSRRYWAVVGVASLFTLARFSEAFLILRAQSIALPDDLIPGVLVVMNVAYALSAYPVGRLSDAMDRLNLLLLGLGLLVVADVVLAQANGVVGLLVGAALWGLHMGFTQGILATLVADEAPEALRGTAFGVFNLISGVALLLASGLAGALWTLSGPRATFLAGAIFAALSGIGLLALQRKSSEG
jgi:MFS family permease